MGKARTINYRKIYEDAYGVKIPSGMDIHHVDENRDNNEPTNLLMLPNGLHGRYHTWKREYDNVIVHGSFNGLLTDQNQYVFTVLAEFGKVCEECLPWMMEKSLLELRARRDANG